jgi:Winged helix-turn helix
MAKARAKGRPIAPLALSAEERTYLERQVRRHRVARSLSERCRIILRCADGVPSKSVAVGLGLHEHTGGKWRRRFLKDRCDGLLDEARPGRPRTIDDDQVAAVIDADLIAPLPILSDGLALFAIRVMPRERVGSLEPLDSAHTPDVVSGRQACRLVERCDRDVNIDGAVVSNDELRAASRAKLSLRPCRGPVDPGLTCDVGEGRGRDAGPSQHWRACRALAHPAMAIARLGGYRSCPVAHRTAETAPVENQFIGHGSCSFEDQHNDSRAKRMTRGCPSSAATPVLRLRRLQLFDGVEDAMPGRCTPCVASL